MNINWKSMGAGFLLGLVGGALMHRLMSKLGNKLVGFFKTIVDATRKEFSAQVESGDYKFDEDFDAVYKQYAGKTAKLKAWLTTYLQTHRYNGIMIQGHLYMFNYDEPKTADSLEFYDISPLVLSFGTYLANTGNLIEYGVNLHMLPVKVRKAFMTDIFNLFKKLYKNKMYSDRPRRINEFNWEQLQTYVDKYGIDFAVRSYIVERRTSVVAFDYKDWAMATLLPSNGFAAGGKAKQQKYTEQYVEALYAKHIANKRKL